MLRFTGLHTARTHPIGCCKNEYCQAAKSAVRGWSTDHAGSRGARHYNVSAEAAGTPLLF